MITMIQTAVSLLTAVLVVTRAINLQPGSAGRSWVDDDVPICLVYAVAARTSIHQGETQAHLVRAARLRPIQPGRGAAVRAGQAP